MTFNWLTKWPIGPTQGHFNHEIAYRFMALSTFLFLGSALIPSWPYLIIFRHEGQVKHFFCLLSWLLELTIDDMQPVMNGSKNTISITVKFIITLNFRKFLKFLDILKIFLETIFEIFLFFLLRNDILGELEWLKTKKTSRKWINSKLKPISNSLNHVPNCRHICYG